jgi:hypothetical protein
MGIEWRARLEKDLSNGSDTVGRESNRNWELMCSGGDDLGELDAASKAGHTTSRSDLSDIIMSALLPLVTVPLTDR